MEWDLRYQFSSDVLPVDAPYLDTKACSGGVYTVLRSQIQLDKRKLFSKCPLLKCSEPAPCMLCARSVHALRTPCARLVHAKCTPHARLRLARTCPAHAPRTPVHAPQNFPNEFSPLGLTVAPEGCTSLQELEKAARRAAFSSHHSKMTFNWCLLSWGNASLCIFK